ncbi:MAG: type II toxin-antitoxin system RelE family toxin, partial [Planctomycetota bacterium]
TIQLTITAGEELRELDSGTRETVLRKIRGLSESPEQQGKPLLAELTGCRSIQTAGRYRIIYKIEKQKVIVIVVCVGIRKSGDKKDIYTIAKKLIRGRLIDFAE